jgi:hypothetical protein
MPAETRESFREVRVFRKPEEDRGISVQRIAAAEGIGVPLVWRILHEQLHDPYHNQRVQAVTPDHRTGLVFVYGLLKTAFQTHSLQLAFC